MDQKHQTTTCPACSLLCDDIVVLSDGRIETHDCEKGADFFRIATDEKRVHHVGGKAASLESAVSAAVNILRQSKAPVICGLDQMTTQAQQIAWKIADRIGASIDTTLSNRQRSNLFSLQRVGKVTASLGEIAQRSDLILFWFCDPVLTHPRLLERLNRFGVNRKIIVVGESDNRTASYADQFLKLAPDRAPAALSVLRSHLIEQEVQCANDSNQLTELAEQLGATKYGAVFYGQTTDDSAFDFAGQSLAALVQTLNESTRFVEMKLRTDANAISAENVLAWSSGYAMAVNHATGFPRSNWLEHSTETILTRSECDAILFATSAGLKTTFEDLGPTAQQHLATIPKIVLSPIKNLPTEVSIQVGVTGVNEQGEFCRNDDVSMPLLTLSGSNCATSSSNADQSVSEIALQEIYDGVSILNRC